MNRARVKKTGEVITINREQDGHYGSKHKMRKIMGDGTFDLMVWYRPDELEVIE